VVTALRAGARWGIRRPIPRESPPTPARVAVGSPARLTVTVRAATERELGALWDQVLGGEHSDAISDGHIGWAFLLDLEAVRRGLGISGYLGAILYAEDGIGPTAAWLYSDGGVLIRAWRAAYGR
jgi:hypothetical protein